MGSEGGRELIVRCGLLATGMSWKENKKQTHVAPYSSHLQYDNTHGHLPGFNTCMKPSVSTGENLFTGDREP